MPRNRRSRLRADRPNPSGVHFLVSKDVLDTLVRTCTPGPDDLVLDLGAGPGVVTAALAGTHARVLAVERDPEFVRTLNSRFRHNDRVRVIQSGHTPTVALPRRDFLVWRTLRTHCRHRCCAACSAAVDPTCAARR